METKYGWQFMACVLMVVNVLMVAITRLDAEEYKLCIPQKKNDLEEQLAISISRLLRQGDETKLGGIDRFAWQRGSVLKIRFLEKKPEAFRQCIIDAAGIWMKFANIKFKFLEDDDPDLAVIRIGFARDGHWSAVGTKAMSISDQKLATMNFGWGNDNPDPVDLRRVVLHEFGHALGAEHEHQLPGTKVIKWKKDVVLQWYMMTQGWSEDRVKKQVFELLSEAHTWGGRTDIDPMSIMMYPIPEEFTEDGFKVGWNNELSDLDKEAIRSIYPFDKKDD